MRNADNLLRPDGSPFYLSLQRSPTGTIRIAYNGPMKQGKSFHRRLRFETPPDKVYRDFVGHLFTDHGLPTEGEFFEQVVATKDLFIETQGFRVSTIDKKLVPKNR